MSNEKLREALQALLASGGEIAEATDDELQAAIDDPDAEEIVKVQAAAVLNALQALATTEPAVNQQLTTEPVDEREAFEKVFPTPAHCQRCGDGYAATSYNAWEAHNHIERWKGWQARAAMAQGANQ